MSQNPLTQRFLSEALTQSGFGITNQPDQAAYALVDGEGPLNETNLTCPFINITHDLPLRLGTIIDQMKNQIKTIENSQSTAPVNIGDMVLNSFDATLTKKTGNIIALTEKEVMILSFIFENHPTPVTRKGLLDGVWGYAENVETHTLETHIYRLRQKIEDNPANPQILMTTESGYCLKF